MFSMRGHNRPMSRPTIPGTDLSSPDVPTAIIYRPSRSATQSALRSASVLPANRRCEQQV